MAESAIQHGEAPRAPAPSLDHLVPIALAAIVAIGLFLRWSGIGEASLSHPEIYIPRVDLSEETQTPPPRFGFLENLVWHFHEETHPVGYYVGMFAWTFVFGDSETALRAPGVLFGVGAIIAIYALAASAYGRVAGLIAASMLALHGVHIFWSGLARMYAPGCFFSLVATLLLVRITVRRRDDAATSAFYVASLVAAIETTELSWALFALHAAWAAWCAGEPAAKGARFRAPKIAVLQVVAFLLSAPALLHAAYVAQGGAVSPPTFDFLLQYAAFGFIFETDEFSDPPRAVSTVLVAAAAILAAILVARGALTKPDRAIPAAAPVAVNPWLIGAAAIASAAFTLWLASIAERRQALLSVIGLLPLAAPAWLAVAPRLKPILVRFARPVAGLVDRIEPVTLLFAVLGVIAPVAIFILSFWKPVAVSRAFIVFVPFLLILASAGLASLLRSPPAFAAAATAAAALFAASAVHAKARPTTPRDYKGLAAAMQEELAPRDLVFIRTNSWKDAPMTYYLAHDRIIGDEFDERLDEADADRVWTFHWADHEDTPAGENIERALDDFRPCRSVSARRGVAILNVRSGSAAESACDARL